MNKAVKSVRCWRSDGRKRCSTPLLFYLEIPASMCELNSSG
ncbi:unnamed protein product [Brassica rapa]|uniref:Uncharacterized protein n=2 Tax=Brassica TaxID=3705 RepID=A0A8D9GVH2_BRACM|nr:unnamed protein product [Brassica napus]CAG7887838.1 unnamed protein product [Brassica rapa]